VTAAFFFFFFVHREVKSRRPFPPRPVGGAPLWASSKPFGVPFFSSSCGAGAVSLFPPPYPGTGWSAPSFPCPPPTVPSPPPAATASFLPFPLQSGSGPPTLGRDGRPFFRGISPFLPSYKGWLHPVGGAQRFFLCPTRTFFSGDPTISTQPRGPSGFYVDKPGAFAQARDW